jgi:hypothetical protein
MQPTAALTEARELHQPLPEEGSNGGLTHVFGRGGGSCWCCGDSAVERQWVPRFGGGAETVTWETEAA